MKLKKFTPLFILLILAFTNISKSDDTTLNFENWTIDTVGLAPVDFYGVLGYGFWQNNIPFPAVRSTNSVRNSYSLRIATVSHQSSLYLTTPRNYTRRDDTTVTNVSSNPDSFIVYINHDIAANDLSGFIIDQFDAAGNLLETNQAAFSGQSTGFMRYYALLNQTAATVDHVQIRYIASVNADVNSVSYIDEVQIKSGHNIELMYNFEDWEYIVVREPVGWFTSNRAWSQEGIQNTQQTLDADQHNSAMFMKGEVHDLTYTGFAVQEFPINKIPDEISGSYKFSSPGNDLALIRVQATHWNGFERDTIGFHEFTLAESMNYTNFTENLPFTGNQNPDTLRITIYPHNASSPATITFFGNELFLDHLTISFQDMPPSDPILHSPVNNETDVSLNPEFSWYSVDEADTYEIGISLNTNFTMLVDHQTGVTDTTYQYTGSGLESLTTYYWVVRAENQAGSGNWSQVWSFETEGAVPGKVTLDTPGDSTEDLSPEMILFSWDPQNHTDSYDLQVSVNPGFIGSPVIDETGIGSPLYFAQSCTLDYETTYYWRVRAENNIGKGEWSDVWMFSTEEEPVQEPDVTILHSPVNMSSDISRQPSFYWYNVIDADSYKLEVSEQSDFSSFIVNEDGLTDTNFSISALHLSYETTYYWRVRAENQGGTGDWSQVWSFETRSEPVQEPDQVVLVSPANMSTNQSVLPLFEWTAADNAETYHLELATDENFANKVEDEQNINALNYQVNVSLQEDMIYYWRVRGENSIGFGDWSNTWSFETEESTSILEIKADAIDFKVYPNPAKQYSRLEFTLKNAENINIAVYDLNGRIIKSILSDSHLAKGNHKIDFNTEHLNSGLYLIKIESSNFISIEKLMIK